MSVHKSSPLVLSSDCRRPSVGEVTDCTSTGSQLLSRSKQTIHCGLVDKVSVSGGEGGRFQSCLLQTDTMAEAGGARIWLLEDADDLQGRVCRILRHVKVPKNNLTKNQRIVLKVLRGLEDKVIILPVEEGNACDRGDEEMQPQREMLGTATYGKMKGDPPDSNPGKWAEL